MLTHVLTIKIFLKNKKKIIKKCPVNVSTNQDTRDNTTGSCVPLYFGRTICLMKFLDSNKKKRDIIIK